MIQKPKPIAVLPVKDEQRKPSEAEQRAKQALEVSRRSHLARMFQVETKK